MKVQLDKWMTEYLYLLEREEDSLERNVMQNKYLHVRRNYDLFCKHLDDGKCFFCSECGVVEHTSKHLVDKCHSCTLWDEREGEHLKTPKLIIGGVMYTDAGNKPNGKYLGFDGTVYKINHKDGTQTITNNLWHGGVIPKKYRLTTMKDNAEFVHENYQPAQYKEQLKMRRVFIATYGEKQLKEDYDNMMARVNKKDETK